MARLEPFRALRYAEPARLGALIAPPYDVVDPPTRARLIARDPQNVVAIDLPQDGDHTAAAALLARWRAEGVLAVDPAPTLTVLAQAFTGPDGVRRTRTGVLGLVATQPYGPGGVRPHERTHPGPREDRRRLTEATNAQLSPVFALHEDPGHAAAGVLARVTRDAPTATATDDEGTELRVHVVTDPATIAELQRAVAAAPELLIADGHHRYETARGLGHPHVLMCLVALDDPGLAVFPTHRLVTGRGQPAYEALAVALRSGYAIEEVPLDELAPAPAPDDPHAMFGYVDAHFRRGFRLRRHAPSAPTDPDAAVLERELLRGPLGFTDDEIDHRRGLAYARTAGEAVGAVLDGAHDLAFLLRATPVEQVRRVARAGLTMPPKSTYFFPKVPTGILFHSLGERG